MIAQEVDLVAIFSLLLIPNVPKIHIQIFINPMTTNVVSIHKKHLISRKTKNTSLYYLIQMHKEYIFDQQWVLKEKKQL